MHDNYRKVEPLIVLDSLASVLMHKKDFIRLCSGLLDFFGSSFSLMGLSWV